MIHATDIASKTKEEVLLTRKQRRLLATLRHQAEKIARRLDPHASTPGAYEFVADDGHLTGYAGMFLIKDLAKRLKVLRLFCDMVTIKKRNCTLGSNISISPSWSRRLHHQGTAAPCGPCCTMRLAADP